MLTILCLCTSSLLGGGQTEPAAPKPTPAPLTVQLEACVNRSVVRTTHQPVLQATVRPTSNGQALTAYQTRNEPRVEATFEVLDCRAGVPQRLRVRYGEVLERRLDPAARSSATEGDAAANPEPTFTTE